MRVLFALLTICIGTLAFANQPTIFRDEDSGLVMEIPAGFRRTWELQNHETGFDLIIFNTNEWDDNLTLIGITKVPMQCYFDQDIGAILPIVFKQLEEVFDSECLEEFGFKAEPLASLADEKYMAQGFRLSFYNQEEDETIQIDVHVFFENGHISVIMTGGYPVETLDEFSRGILKKVRFIEE